MRILITGGKGLLGTELVKYFEKRGETVIAPSHEMLDVTKKEGVHTALREAQPDLLINCAVIINVDICEANQQRCYAVNRDGVKNILLAIQESKRPITFVQISSSEVFGRINKNEFKIDGYKENDECRPASSYQKSKKEAEEIIEKFVIENPKTLKNYYIARAGWLYGEARETFVDIFFNKLQSKNPLTLIKDQWRSPTWTKYFAVGLNGLLEGNYPSGIYHIVNEVRAGEATTADVIHEINRHLGNKAANPQLNWVGQKDFFKVPRAPSNVLLNTKLPKLPYWRDALQEYLTKYHPLA